MHTFRETAQSYIENGGSNRYLPRVVDYFGDMDIKDIHPFDIKKMAETLYPEHKGATRNRQAVCPARAVVLHGYDRGWCLLIRVRMFKEDRPVRKEPASHIWIHAFIRQCEKDGLQHLGALVLFMSVTAARVTETTSLLWKDVHLAQRFVVLLKTKTGVNSHRALTDELIVRMQELQKNQGPNDRVFRYQGRQAINQRIRAVCKRADISYKSSHMCGRHAFATNAIDSGVDIRTAMDAGDWRSSSIFLETYVHTRTNAARIVADKLGSYSYDSRI